MNLTQLPLEIQHAIFETLIVCYEPKDFVRARLASTYFATQIHEAFTRTDECFDVYLKTRPGRLGTKYSRELESRWLAQRLRSDRPCLLEAGAGGLEVLKHLRFIMDEVRKWEQDERFDGSPDIFDILVTRILEENHLRSVIALREKDFDILQSSFKCDLLCAAAALGQLHIVHELLDDGIPAFHPHEVQYKFLPNRHLMPFGYAPACAARFGHLEVLKVLLQSYVNLENLTPWGKNIQERYAIEILTAAMAGGHSECLEYMLGDEVFLSFDHGGHHGIVCRGVEAGNLEGVKMILGNIFEDFPHWDRPQGVEDDPPAAPRSHDRRANSRPRRASARPTQDTGPPWAWEMSYILEQACMHRQTAFVRFALAHGATSGPHATRDWIFRPACAAAASNSLEILEILLTHSKSNSLHLTLLPSRRHPAQHPLEAAIQHNRPAIVRLLLDHGAVPDTVLGRSWGDTPLTKAIRLGHAEIVELLLSRGASMTFAGATKWMKVEDFRKPSVWNQAYLMATAAGHGHAEVVRVLGRHGVSPRFPEGRARRREWLLTHDPMCAALRAGRGREDEEVVRREVVRALVELGAEDPEDAEAGEYLVRAIEAKGKKVGKRKSGEVQVGGGKRTRSLRTRSNV